MKTTLFASLACALTLAACAPGPELDALDTSPAELAAGGASGEGGSGGARTLPPLPPSGDAAVDLYRAQGRAALRQLGFDEAPALSAYRESAAFPAGSATTLVMRTAVPGTSWTEQAQRAIQVVSQMGPGVHKAFVRNPAAPLDDAQREWAVVRDVSAPGLAPASHWWCTPAGHCGPTSY